MRRNLIKNKKEEKKISSINFWDIKPMFKNRTHKKRKDNKKTNPTEKRGNPPGVDF